MYNFKAERRMKHMATPAKSTPKRLLSPAIKPGTYGDYLWNLPDEEIDRMLEEAGFDIKEVNCVAREGGRITWINAKNKFSNIQKSFLCKFRSQKRKRIHPQSPRVFQDKLLKEDILRFCLYEQ
jgi:hypothetical protein